MQKGFTLIELVVVVAIIVILSAIILFTVNQYIDKGKDSNIKGNLAILVASGEKYYDGLGGNSYGDIGGDNFCTSNVVENAKNQIPSDASFLCTVNASGDRWAACAKLFTDGSKAYCVDSVGVKEEANVSACSNTGSIITEAQCP